MAAAYDAGIRYFDTAPLYGHGIAERELGRFVADCRARGETAPVLATKAGRIANPWLLRYPRFVRPHMVARALVRRIPGFGSGDAPSRFDSGWIRSSVESSLSRLGIDCIDIVYLHEPTPLLLVDPDGVADTVARLKSEGKIRHAGMSGRIEDLLPIAARQPKLAEVLQVDARSGEAGLAQLRNGGRTVQVSFEHMRAVPGGSVAAVVDAAQAFNRAGVIVLSTADHEALLAAVARLAAASPPAVAA